MKKPELSRCPICNGKIGLFTRFNVGLVAKCSSCKREFNICEGKPERTNSVIAKMVKLWNDSIRGHRISYIEKISTTENGNISLCTFPDDDKDYCKTFEVPKKWLCNTIKQMSDASERRKESLEVFLDNYVWDETWFIYLQAKLTNNLLSEQEVE